MSQRERIIVGIILGIVTVLVAADIFNDSREGVVLWHVTLEGFIALVSIVGMFFVFRDSFKTRKTLSKERENFSAYRIEAENWQKESRKYVEGLSLAIDQQLTKWSLTAAEREVAFLLLKGLSLKEIAEIRNTTEKTARVQSMAIYSKAGLAGRSELSAFFLEDLLAPNTSS